MANPKTYLFRMRPHKPQLLHDPLRRKFLLLPLRIIEGEPKVSDILLKVGWATKVNKEVIVTPALYFLFVEAQ